MKWFKKILIGIMCISMLVPNIAYAAEVESTQEESMPSSASAGNEKEDVTLSVANTPTGKYGEGINISFSVVGDNVTVNQVYPYVNETFPFETNNDAYRITNGPDCSYNFTVRDDVATGYHPVTFVIVYTKEGKECTTTKTINVKLEGKPAQTEATTEAPAEAAVSVPRLIVTGYETNPATVMAGQEFTLTIHVKNTAQRTISNIKIAVEAAEGEFLPVSGSSTKYIESLGAGKTTDIVLEMKAKSDLEQKPYTLSINSEYEDKSFNPYTAADSISIPVSQEARLSVTSLEINPEIPEVGSQVNVMFSINNLGKGTLYNVMVDFTGDVLDAEESFIGNIAPGATGYFDVMAYVKEASYDADNVTAVISYENANGESFTMEYKISVVAEEMVSQEDYFEEEFEDTQGEANVIVQGAMLAGTMIGVIVIIVIVIVLVSLSKKRKRKEEEEILEDELS